MRPKTWSYTPLDDSTTYFKENATGVGPFTMTTTTSTDGLAHKVSLSSASNLSTITITVTGTDADGRAQTEAITGPNANTVAGSKFFLTVASATASATLGANELDFGMTDACVGPTIPVNWRANPFELTMFVDIGGTINYDVEYTSQDVFGSAAPSTLTWLNHGTIVAKTADTDGSTTVPIRAIRLAINSSTSGATASLTAIQGGG